MFTFWTRLWERKSARPDEDAGTYLGPGVEVEGKIKVEHGPIRVNTRLKGEMLSDGLVILGDRADVEATIHAKAVSVAGKVTGNIHVSDYLEVKEHGRVLGDVYARVLSVEPGGYVEGQCKMPIEEVDEQPQKAPSPLESNPSPNAKAQAT
jgi:cytoskeletal protein CcmA (bactofilin family)